jgi:hypothetical protein
VPAAARFFRPSEGVWLAGWMKYQVFIPIALLQLVNLFWYYLMCVVEALVVFFGSGHWLTELGASKLAHRFPVRPRLGSFCDARNAWLMTITRRTEFYSGKTPKTSARKRNRTARKTTRRRRRKLNSLHTHRRAVNALAVLLPNASKIMVEQDTSAAPP